MATCSIRRSVVPGWEGGWGRWVIFSVFVTNIYRFLEAKFPSTTRGRLGRRITRTEIKKKNTIIILFYFGKNAKEVEGL